MIDNACSTPDWQDIACRLQAATGPDPLLDKAFGQTEHLTASAESARAWAAVALPGWHAHVGFDATGVLPYAVFSRDGRHVEARGPTVPLAILRAAVAVLAGDVLEQG